MTDERPSVSPELVAAVTELAPDRVRRRLDRSPDAASAWTWKSGPEVWTVNTGGETVSLPRDRIQSLDQLSCTCLLAPNCFHVLACLTALDLVDHTTAVDGPGEASVAVDRAAAETIQPTEKQQHAARELATCVAQLLHIGVANAGVVAQSGLLRAVHQSRAEGLHRASTIGLRVIVGARQFRARSAESDPAQLAEDIATVLEVTQRVQTQQEVASSWIGTARRRQFPVRPRKLHGLLAEPIVTRSGYAGASVCFLGEDDRIYTTSDVRPGGAQLARDAYLGGIEIGPMIQPAKQLARGLYLGTELTASHDGRLGRGKSIRIVEQGESSWRSEAVQIRFRRPLIEQWNTIYSSATLPDDVRPAGWDFVFLTGKVIGALGPALLFQLEADEQPIRLTIENENDELFFRHNLRLLSHAPGLRLQVIARIHLQDPTIVFPLAITQSGADDKAAPRMALPKALRGRVFVGLDEVQRKHLLNAQRMPVLLSEPPVRGSDDPLAALRRRWIARMLSGATSQRPTGTNTFAVETAALHRLGFSTGAALLDALTRSADSEIDSDKTFLAVGVYLRRCLFEWAKGKATHSAS